MGINRTGFALETMLGHLAHITFETNDYYGRHIDTEQGWLKYNAHTGRIDFVPKGSRHPYNGFPIDELLEFQLIRKDVARNALQLRAIMRTYTSFSS